VCKVVRTLQPTIIDNIQITNIKQIIIYINKLHNLHSIHIFWQSHISCGKILHIHCLVIIIIKIKILFTEINFQFQNNKLTV